MLSKVSELDSAILCDLEECPSTDGKSLLIEIIKSFKIWFCDFPLPLTCQHTFSAVLCRARPCF